MKKTPKRSAKMRSKNTQKKVEKKSSGATPMAKVRKFRTKVKPKSTENISPSKGRPLELGPTSLCTVSMPSQLVVWLGEMSKRTNRSRSAVVRDLLAKIYEGGEVVFENAINLKGRSGKADRTLTAQVTSEQLDWIDERAHARKSTRSQIVREVFDAVVAAHKAGPW